jgi:PAS domain S-box-containing protein
MAMVERVPAMLFRLSPAGHITWINKSGAAMLGYTVDEVLRWEERASFSAETGDSPNQKAVHAAIAAGEGIDWTEFRVRHRDGRVLTVRTTFAPIRDESHTLIGFDGITVDITAEAEAKSRLVAVDSLMTLGLFAAGLGHEVSTPAASVSLALEQLRRQLSDLAGAKRPTELILAEATGVLDEALHSIRDIGNIVEHLRVLARGASSRARTPVALADLVAAATALAGPELKRRANLQIELSAHPLLATDCAPLTLVLLNLLTNAQQAVADSGSKQQHHVRVSSLDKGEEGVEIAVSDDGPGIPEEVRGRIFDPFFTTKQQGTGIGLAVSSELVRRMGGHILVESEVGKGATFRVHIPKERVLAREWRTHGG